MILRWGLTLQAVKGIRVENIQQSDNKKFSVNEMTVAELLSVAPPRHSVQEHLYKGYLFT